MQNIETVHVGNDNVHAAAYSSSGSGRYAILDTFGQLLENATERQLQAYEGHVFTAVDVDADGTVYACDDTSGSVCAISAGTTDVRELVSGTGFDSVHENAGVLSMCADKTNKALVCDTSGRTSLALKDVTPSVGFSMRMLLVWASGIYLVALIAFIAVRKAKRLIGEGKTEGIGPLFMATAVVIAIALLIVLPSTVAAGYPSLMFPLFSADLGLSKSDINNIVVLGQLIVFICINLIEHMEGRLGKLKLATLSVALLGAVFLLFSFNATLAWSVAVIALVGLLCKTSDAWKSLWLNAASEAGVSAGRATGVMFSVRSLARVAQPFILGGLLGVSGEIAFIAIGAFCVACAGLFFLLTRKQ